jgi:hypothetical protein
MVISKFTIGSDQGLNTLVQLTAAITREKLAGRLSPEAIEKHIGKTFNRKAITTEINSMSNQYVTVYVDDEPAGYARISSRGEKPGMLADKRALGIAEFGVLQKFIGEGARESLLQKCLAVVGNYDTTWINELRTSIQIPFFESNGFVPLENETPEYAGLSLPSVYLVKRLPVYDNSGDL